MSRTVHTPSALAYASVRTEAALVDRATRLRMMFEGAHAAETLNGLLTSDVLAVQPGHGQYAAALTPKGKVLADVRVLRRLGGEFLVDVSAAAAPGFTAMVRKYVNPRLTAYRDVSSTLGCIGVAGPHARQVVAHALGCSPSVFDMLPAYASADVPLANETVFVARTADYGVEAFDCYASVAAVERLREAFTRAGAIDVGSAALETVRIEAGRPAWGVDMNDDTLSQEALLDTLDAISYTKGCYTGQEVVARLHFRGHVNRLLRGLRLEGDDSAAALLAEDDLRVMRGEADVGDVRSRAVSPRHGPIALAMLRREVEPASTVTVQSAHGGVAATVVALPFTS